MSNGQLAATGVSGLDAILGGGLPAGHLYLIDGDPGAGKTTLALQFLLEGARRGERVLYVTLSESASEVDKVAASHGWNLGGIQVLEMASSVGADGSDDYTIFRPSDVELAGTTKRVMEFVDKARPQRVVIDSLSELRLLAQEPLRYRRQILGLKHYFSGKGQTVLMLDDRTVQSSDLQPQSIAHGVVELDQIATEYGSERRRLRVVKLRGAAFKGGYHDFTIRTGGVVVFPRLTVGENEREFDQTPARSEMPAFDELIGGGIDRGTSTLITGPAGTGKSTLAMKLVDAAAKRGEHSAIFAFEENKRIMTRRGEALGLSIGSHIKNGLLAFRHIDPAELSPGEFAAAVRAEVEEQNARIVVIDSLNGYLNSMPEERFLTAQLHELLGYLNNRGVVTILVLAQRGMMGAGMSPPVDVSYLADAVVMVRHFEAFGSVRKAISVVKKRTGGHEDTIRELLLEDGKLSIGDALVDFKGVLTGVPTFVGDERTLTDGRAKERGGQ